MKPNILVRFGIVCAVFSAAPVSGLAEPATTPAPVALGPELLGLVRMAGETSAFLVDAQRARHWPMVLKPDEGVLGMMLLSADLEAGVARIKREQMIEDLRIPPPPPGFPEAREKVAWSFRLHRFPVEALCRIYAMLGEAALLHPGLGARLRDRPIALDIAAGERGHAIRELELALAGRGVRVQHVGRKFVLLSDSRNPAPVMKSWPTPLGAAAGQLVPAGALQIVRMQTEQVLELYSQLCGRTLERPNLGRPSGPELSRTITLVSGCDLTQSEAKQALETALDWVGVRGVLTEDGKLRGEWRE